MTKSCQSLLTGRYGATRAMGQGQLGRMSYPKARILKWIARRSPQGRILSCRHTDGRPLRPSSFKQGRLLQVFSKDAGVVLRILNSKQ